VRQHDGVELLGVRGVTRQRKRERNARPTIGVTGGDDGARTLDAVLGSSNLVLGGIRVKGQR
jgi:hypothetical protein